MRKTITAAAMLAFGCLAPLASADEASIKAAMQRKYPQAQVESVTKTPIPGIYEVYTDGQLIYSDENAAHLFLNATLVDTEKKISLTQERISRLTAIKFDQLPLNLAFKKVKGKGTRKIAVFSDPDCPFCKQIEPVLAKLENITIYMFLFPIDGIHPQATDKAKRVWCSPDRVKAWDDLMQRGITPAAAPDCNNPVAKLVEFGIRHKINGTPTLIFADGRRVPGSIPLEQIEQHLAAAASSK